MLNANAPRPGLIASTLSLAGLIILSLTIMFAAHDQAWRAAHYFHPAKDPLWTGLLAQLIHLNTAHAALNLAGLFTLSLAAWFLNRLPWVVPTLLASGVAVCIGLQLESPPIAWYVGLSGALYGGWAALCLEIGTNRQTPPALKSLAGLACLGIGCKAAIGLSTSEVLGSMPVAHQAHLYGYAGGLVFAACLLIGPCCARRLRTRAA